MAFKRLQLVLFVVTAGFVVAVVVLASIGLIEPVTAGVSALVAAAVAAGAYLARRPGSPVAPDERTKRIDSRAISWSWILTLTLVSVLYLVNHFGIYDLSESGLLGIILLFMAYSRLVTTLVLRQRPDVSE